MKKIWKILTVLLCTAAAAAFILFIFTGRADDTLNALTAEDMQDGIVRSEIELKSPNGLMLKGYLEGPAAALEGGKKCPLIVFMHGLMDSVEYSLIRRQTAFYTAAGCAVLAVDFNGHGASEGKITDMTISSEILDGEMVLDFAEGIACASEIILAGHSQGGAVASVLASRHSEKIDRLVLLAPSGQIPDIIRSGNFFGNKFNPSCPPEKIKVFDSFLGSAYIIDALKLDLFAMAEGWKGPVLLVAAEKDTLVPSKVISRYEQLYKDNKPAPVTRQIPGASHTFRGMDNHLSEAVLEFIK